MITNYEDYCIICNRPKEHTHHCVFGVSKRKLADVDGLTMPLCQVHHEMMHRGDIQTLSKIIGQLFYERNKCAQGMTPDEAREAFRKRYSESYL